MSGEKFTINKIPKYLFNINNIWLMIAILFEKHTKCASTEGVLLLG